MRRYELSWTWTSAAMSCHAALEEIGADYSLRFIDFDQPWPTEDLQLNPNRKVPTLTDHGETGAAEPIVIYQSAAILLYLAGHHPGTGLMPKPATAAYGQCMQQLFFMAEMLQPSYMMYYYPERHTASGDGLARDAVADKAVEWIVELWGRIDTYMDERPYILGSDLSVCDLFAIPMLVWSERDERLQAVASLSAIDRLRRNLWSRPAIERVLAAHVEP